VPVSKAGKHPPTHCFRKPVSRRLLPRFVPSTRTSCTLEDRHQRSRTVVFGRGWKPETAYVTAYVRLMRCNPALRGLLNATLNAVQFFRHGPLCFSSRHFSYCCTGCTEFRPFSFLLFVPSAESPAPSRAAARRSRAAETSPGHHFLCSVPEQKRTFVSPGQPSGEPSQTQPHAVGHFKLSESKREAMGLRQIYRRAAAGHIGNEMPAALWDEDISSASQCGPGQRCFVHAGRGFSIGGRGLCQKKTQYDAIGHS